MKNVDFLDFVSLGTQHENFLDLFFGQAPLVRKNCCAVKTGDEIPTVSTLFALLEKMPPSNITVQNPTPVPSGFYTNFFVQKSERFGARAIERIDKKKVLELYDAGALVIWRNLQNFHENLDKSREGAAKFFRAPSDSYAFLSSPGYSGTSVHDDPDDIFAVQVEGTKRWKIWCPVDSPREVGKYYDATALREPAVDVTLEPGDFLYIPRHAPHATYSTDMPSLHVSVAVKLDLLSTIAVKLVTAIIEEDAKFSELVNWTQGSDNPVVRLKGELGHLVNEILESDDLATRVGRIARDRLDVIPTSGWS